MERLIKSEWWKWLTMALLAYTVVGGFLMYVPRLPILNETIRVLYFHVPMWFGMLFLFGFGVYYGILYLRTSNLRYDLYSGQLVQTGLLFGVLGLLTGMLWATHTWGEPWSNDPQQNGSAIGLLIYLAYTILRGSISDEHQRARLSSVYGIFAFALLIPLLFILPRLTDSLHPGSGGNPGFNAYDLDSNLRMVFYPAVVGWTLLGFWIASIRVRVALLEIEDDD